MTGPSKATQVLAILRAEADACSAPSVRHATLDRLVEACDALAGGSSDPIVLNIVEFQSRPFPAITPTNIGRYVRKRQGHDRAWTGPARETIQSDPGLREYVRLRREEQSPIPVRKHRASDGRRALEDALSSVPLIESAQLLRDRIAEGDLAKRKLDLVTAGLKQLDINLESLMRGDTTNAAGIAQADRNQIRRFLERVMDIDFLELLGFEIQNLNVRQIDGLGSILLNRTELEAMSRVAGMTLST